MAVPPATVSAAVAELVGLGLGPARAVGGALRGELRLDLRVLRLEVALGLCEAALERVGAAPEIADQALVLLRLRVLLGDEVAEHRDGLVALRLVGEVPAEVVVPVQEVGSLDLGVAQVGREAGEARLDLRVLLLDLSRSDAERMGAGVEPAVEVVDQRLVALRRVARDDELRVEVGDQLRLAAGERVRLGLVHTRPGRSGRLGLRREDDDLEGALDGGRSWSSLTRLGLGREIVALADLGVREPEVVGSEAGIPSPAMMSSLPTCPTCPTLPPASASPQMSRQE